MNEKIVGFSITTELLFDENILEKIENVELGKLLVRMEDEIACLLANKFRAKVIGGKGKHIKVGKDNVLIK